MKFEIITIFPNIFESYFNESIIGRAIKENKIKINYHNIRDFTKDKHKKVDDKPYSGGVGMVMKIEPLFECLNNIKKEIKSKIILLSPRGKKLKQSMCREYSNDFEQIILICGRYEGVDERIINFIDEEVSIGDYILTGGELGAMVLVDSVSRLLNGVLGKDESSKDESHSKDGYIEYPHYTRPEKFIANNISYDVPAILLSGNHMQIEKWKKENSKL